MARREPAIPPELIDQLLDGSDPKKGFESEGLLDELKKALAERILDAEWMCIWDLRLRRLATTTVTAAARRQY